MKLLDNIKNKSAVMGVVGFGYVGLPLAVGIAKAGFKTIGFDVQNQKYKQLIKALTTLAMWMTKNLKILSVKGN